MNMTTYPHSARSGVAPEGGQETSDLVLVRQVGCGDMSALEELYRRHNRRVYSLCLRMTSNVGEAEDLTQEIFIKLFHEAGTFRGEAAFTTWLHRLTVNVVLMYFRKHKRRFERPVVAVELPERQASVSVRAEDISLLDRLTLDMAMAALPPGYRAVFVLFAVAGHSHDEIARLLDCSAGTSKSQLHKARAKLRALLSRGAIRPKRRFRAASHVPAGSQA